MFSFMLQKLIHKKWMVLCLLTGNILLIAVAVSHPMYRVSSFQKMLADEFEQHREAQGCWPASFTVTHGTIKGGASVGYAAMEENAEETLEKLGVEAKEQVAIFHLSSQKAKAGTVRDGEEEKRITLAAASDLEEHVELLQGKFPESSADEDGIFEVMVSDKAMAMQNILLGDEYDFEKNILIDEKPCRVKVVGIFGMKQDSLADRLYWEVAKGCVHDYVFLTEEAFRKTFLGSENEKKYSMDGSWSYLLDYETIDITEVSGLIRVIGKLEADPTLEGKLKQTGYPQVLEDYSSKAKRIEATLLILQIPVLFLLCAFLYMISGQMLQMEQNEISLLQSRGASKTQIFFLYLMQSAFLAFISLLPGVFLGALICKLLGSSTAFLQFSMVRSLELRFTFDILLYGAGAFLVSVCMTIIPAFSYSGLSIVNVKQGRMRKKKSLWKKMYLDVVFLAVSLYGFYSFKRSSEQMMEDVLSGRSLDPLLYISFSLFVLGAGLFMARLQPLILRGIFAIFKNHMEPSTYASFLGTIRTGRKQEFIILFMILTVSIGISNTTMARTIVLNTVKNTRHLTGAQITLQEKWMDNRPMLLSDPGLQLQYYEPDFSKYEVIPGVECATRVLFDRSGKMVVDGESMPVMLMGIQAKGFSQVTSMEDELLPYLYAEYLNMLSVDPQVILVSENFLVQLGYKLGDLVIYENKDGWRGVGRIYGFFPYWPAYQPETYSLGEDGAVQKADQYMIVANISYMLEQWDAWPYQVWMAVEDGGEGFYEWISEQKSLTLSSLHDMAQEEDEIVRDTLFQGTNGILSMSFIVILLLCCVGYLIYWIMSIRSRELLFGVLRAMGMRKREITWLLVVEQICSGLYAIVAGALIGILASRMFVPMLQQAYAASEQVLPLQLITRTSDLIQLFAVIGAMLCVCLIVLGRIVSKMNISSALKLGED